MNLAFMTAEPFGVYCGKESDYLTARNLAAFRKCPALFRRRQQGLAASHDAESYSVIAAVRVFATQGKDEFERRFAIGGPINPTTGKPYGTDTKKFQEWVDQQNKPAFSLDDAARIELLASSVRGHLIAAELLELKPGGARLGKAEHVARGSYSGVECQARPDYINERGDVVMIKDCRDLDEYELAVEGRGHIHEAAFIRGLILVVSGRKSAVYSIVVETGEPFRCGVWRFSNALLECAAEDNEAAIYELQQCAKHGVWPDGFERLRSLNDVAS